jgi:hypothetical protein
MNLKKFFISCGLIFTVTGCEQTEIETPLYEQPKRRVNAQMLGGMNQINAPQVYNNPAMAQYTIPGRSLSAVGQGPANINGALSPWAYMPAPTNSVTPSQALVSRGGMPPMQGGMGVAQQGFPTSQNVMMPSQVQMMQQNPYGQQMQQAPSTFPPVQYGAPPFAAQPQGFGGETSNYGSPTLPAGASYVNPASPYGMPPMQGDMGAPMAQPPMPSGPGSIMMELQQEMEDMNKPVSYNQYQPMFFNQNAQALPAIQVASVGESYDLPSLGKEYEDFEQQVANDIKDIDKVTEEKNRVYSIIEEDEISLSETEEGFDDPALFDFFNDQGEPTNNTANNIPQQPKQPQQEYVNTPIQQAIPTQQYIAPITVAQQPIQVLTNYQNPVQVKPIFIDNSYSNNKEVAYTNAPPKSISYRYNIYGDKQNTKQKTGYRNPSANSNAVSVNRVAKIDNNYNYLSGFKDAPKYLPPIRSQSTKSNISRNVYNAPKSMIYKSKGVSGAKDRIAEVRRSPIKVITPVIATPRYKEDYAPLTENTGRTWYPKSMTRI